MDCCQEHCRDAIGSYGGRTRFTPAQRGFSQVVLLVKFGWSGFQTTDLKLYSKDILVFLKSDSGVASTKRNVAALLQNRCFQSDPSNARNKMLFV